MKLAILIGVSKYAATGNDLPGCFHDIELMEKLINATGKYDKILKLMNEPSVDVKSKLANFIDGNKDQKPDELFFYYTGHGEITGDDFCYLLADFDRSKPSQTSIGHRELDEMFRSLAPKLMVKIVDACHAGVAYIKDNEALAKQLKESEGRFHNCYFMFSCQDSQSSFQNTHVSDFTAAFVEACVSFTGADVRYRDIIAHISDAFRNNKNQTPKFIIQASATEVFCAVKDAVRNIQMTKKVVPSVPTAPTQKHESLTELVAKQAKEYVTKEKALEFLNGLKEEIAAGHLPSEIDDLYNLTVIADESYGDMPNMASLGKWLEDNNKSGDYMASVTYKSEQYEAREFVLDDPEPVGFRPLASLWPEGKYKNVTRTRQVPSGIRSTVETIYEAIRLNVVPKFPNLPFVAGFFVYVLSKRECVLFYGFQALKETDWDQPITPVGIKWIFMPVLFSNDPKGQDAAKKLLQQLENYLRNVVRSKLGLKETSQTLGTDTGKENENSKST